MDLWRDVECLSWIVQIRSLFSVPPVFSMKALDKQRPNLNLRQNIFHSYKPEHHGTNESTSYCVMIAISLAAILPGSCKIGAYIYGRNCKVAAETPFTRERGRAIGKSSGFVDSHRQRWHARPWLLPIFARTTSRASCLHSFTQHANILRMGAGWEGVAASQCWLNLKEYWRNSTQHSL